MSFRKKSSIHSPVENTFLVFTKRISFYFSVPLTGLSVAGHWGLPAVRCILFPVITVLRFREKKQENDKYEDSDCLSGKCFELQMRES